MSEKKKEQWFVILAIVVPVIMSVVALGGLMYSRQNVIITKQVTHFVASEKHEEEQDARINGNTDDFNSRVYLWNPSTSAGEITVRVFTMPRPGPSDPPEPSQLLGTLELGSLEAESARTIRIEEVLSQPEIEITLPYQEQGGNLMLEFTIEAAGVRGTAQVFNNSLTLAFGTYPLQVIP